MRDPIQILRHFLGFALLAGLGWLCDFATFTLLVRLLGVPNFLANFISSYVGVTFVWFTSLRLVFRVQGGKRSLFLLAYWGFQFVSILAYSQLLHAVSAGLQDNAFFGLHGHDVDLAAKIIITPFNLVTNFIFMKLLTSHMHRTRSLP